MCIRDSNPTGGRSFVIYPKYYTNLEAPLDLFYGIQYRNRKYSFDSEADITVIDLTANWGVQFQLKNNFTLDISTGIGLRVPQQEGVDPNLEQTRVSFPLSIKTGYLF